MATEKHIWEVQIEALIGLHKAETRLARITAAPSPTAVAARVRNSSPSQALLSARLACDDESALLVSGAGTMQVNGLYTKTAQVLGRPVWTKTDDSNYLIQWSETIEAWMIDYLPGNAPYRIEGRKELVLPLEAAWSTYQGGKAPMPTVKAASGSAADSMQIGGLRRGMARVSLEPEAAEEKKKGGGQNFGARLLGRSPPRSSPVPAPAAELASACGPCGSVCLASPEALGDDSDSDKDGTVVSNPAHSSTMSSYADTKCAKLDHAIVEVQIGQMTMRTGEIKVTGEEARVEVAGQVLRLPAPPPSSGFAVTVRVLQAGTRFHSEKLVGEAVFEEATGESVELALFRHGKGKAKGGVQLAVTPVEELPEETLARTEGLAFAATGGRTGYVGKRTRVGGLIGRILPKANNVSEQNVDMRQALLAEEGREFPKIGDITLTIESVERVMPRVKYPFLVAWLGEQEGGQMNLENFTEPVQEHFVMRHVESNVVLLVYDGDPSTPKNPPVGRILLPLSDLFWTSGSAPDCGQLCSLLRSPKKLSKSYEARFMPLSGDGRDAHFQPAWAGAAGTGIWKKDVFGAVGLRIDLDFDKLAKRSMLRQHIEAFRREVKRLRLRTQVSSFTRPEEAEVEESLWSVINSVDISRILRIAGRAKNMINDIVSGRAKGFIRWVRAKKWHGVVVGILWFAFCICGGFPPKPFLWPVYIWAALLINGLIAARQRQNDWQHTTQPPFHVWNEEIDAPPPSTSISEKLAVMKKGALESERITDNIVSAADRLSQMFLFADAPASVLVYMLSFAVVILLSLAWYGLSKVDPDAHWSIGLVGLVIFPLCSIPLPKKTQEAIQKDPLLPLVNFNAAFSFVPDQTEIAHRYIAGHIQCTSGKPVDCVRITLISAKGLRAADTGTFRQGSSDPYCVVEIPGKPASKLTTEVIMSTLKPEWNYEGFIEDFFPGDSLIFTVWDWDRASRDDLLGRAALKSTQFHPDGFDGELVLSDAGEGNHATLLIRITIVLSRRFSH